MVSIICRSLDKNRKYRYFFVSRIKRIPLALAPNPVYTTHQVSLGSGWPCQNYKDGMSAE